MITGASRKPLSAVRSPVVPLNENVAPGAISVRSISCGDEPDVVQPVRPRRRRSSCSSRPGLLIPMRLASAAVRSRRPCARRAAAPHGRFRSAAARIALRGGRERRAATPSRSGTISTPLDVIRKSAFSRGLSTERFKRASQRSAFAPAERELPLAAVGQVEKAGQPPARQAPARLVERERHGRRQRRARLGRGRLQLDCGDARAPNTNRQRDRDAREAGKRVDDRLSAAASRSSERPSRPGTTSTFSPRRRNAASRSGRSISRASFETKKSSAGLVHLRGRMDVTAEDADADPAEARGTVAKPSPCRRAASTPAAQLTSTPSALGLILQVRPPARNSTGTWRTRSARRSSFARASSAWSPPTGRPRPEPRQAASSASRRRRSRRAHPPRRRGPR